MTIDELLAAEGAASVDELLERRAVLTVPEAGAVFGVSRSAAFRAIARGELPALRVGRRVVVPVHALRRILDGAA